jgi:hypothetical protein
MKRQTLETVIREILSPVLSFDPAATFDAWGCELWSDGDGWSFNDAFRMVADADLSGVQSIARSRWGIFRLNYAPRARVADVMALEWQPSDRALYIECAFMSFLEIRVNYSATI